MAISLFSGGKRVISRPSFQMLPQLTALNPQIELSNVVFPHPEAPSKATNSFFSTSKLIFSIPWWSHSEYLHHKHSKKRSSIILSSEYRCLSALDIQYNSVILDRISAYSYHNHQHNLFLIILTLWQNCYYFVTNIKKYIIISINYIHMA